MEKIITIPKKDLDFKISQIKTIERIDLHEDKIELIVNLEE